MLNKIKRGALWFWKSFIWLFILMLALDLVSKLCVVNFLRPEGGPNSSVALIPGFLNVTYVVNTNAAFGVGLGDATANRAMYIALAAIASIVIIAIFIKKYKSLTGMYKATMMLILTGALGNMIDRIFYTPEFLQGKAGLNGVVDWIDFRGIWSYVFNWADACIVVGCIMLIIYLIVLEVKEKKANRVKLAKEVKNTPAATAEVNEIADKAIEKAEKKEAKEEDVNSKEEDSKEEAKEEESEKKELSTSKKKSSNENK